MSKHTSQVLSVANSSNQVYDLTDFQHVHPGGSSRIQMSAGRDVTVVFETMHPSSATSVLQQVETFDRQECLLLIFLKGVLRWHFG